MQNIKLNLIPGAVMPVVNVSQYDKARQFSITVYEGSATYSLTGKDVQIRGTKPDGNGFAYDSTDGVVSVSGSTVTISTTQQMTAVGGQTMAELRITQSGVIRGTLNFVLMVEPSALSDDTPISDTDIPAIERDFEAALAEAEADALKAEGYAVGTQDGTPAQSGEPYYQDNAKYYKEQAEAAASGGGADALKAEGYAVGTQNGVPVTSGSPYYHNNAAYYEGEASTSATNAATSETNAGLSETAAGNSATNAAADALKSEGWAVGKQNGTPVTSGSPYYENNAEYYKDQAAQYAAGGLIFKGSVAFASIPTTGMVNGDMYNITDDFTTDNRFIEGSGVSVKAGADIAWVDSVSKWDILALGGGSDDYSQLINKPQINSHTLTGDQTAAALGLASDAAMTGATAGTAGAKGLVPAPAAGDEGKFLRGDGTWAEGGGGSTTIVQIPSVVVGTYTYTGSAQGPTITGLDAAHTIVTGDTATNVGNYTLTIALADPQTMVWSDLTTADKTYAWSIGKAPGAVTLSKNTVVLSDNVPSDTVTISDATGAISISSSDTGVATVSPSTMAAPGGTLSVAGVASGTATVTVSIAASANYNATTATISVTMSIQNKVYGAVWDGSSSTAWTRTDDAATFSDPQPYYSGMSGTPSSPFDNIEPWSGMVRDTDANAGEVVAIPKFYYKMGYASGTTGLKIQIAPASNGAAWATANGFKVSPAHMDRGDGKGERNTVYISRYQIASDYTSKTGVLPKVSAHRATFRSGITALGTSVHQLDYATLTTLWMLYLVEFADWNSQAKIGGGCSETTATSSAVYNTGATDSMPYHTGTTSTSIGATVYGANQYRNIENLWGNAFQYTEGINFNGTSVYAELNPANFADGASGTVVYTRPGQGGGYIKSLGLSSVSDFEWFWYPSDFSGSNTTYVSDNIWNSGTGTTYPYFGGNYSQNQESGLFRYLTGAHSGYADPGMGARLMLLF